MEITSTTTTIIILTKCFAGLDKNQYDKDKCQDEFEAYKECKKVEVATRAQRREAEAEAEAAALKQQQETKNNVEYHK